MHAANNIPVRGSISVEQGIIRERFIPVRGCISVASGGAIHVPNPRWGFIIRDNVQPLRGCGEPGTVDCNRYGTPNGVWGNRNRPILQIFIPYGDVRRTAEPIEPRQGLHIINHAKHNNTISRKIVFTIIY